MRVLISFFIICFSGSLWAQENRSATELARENITDYITNKVFPGKNYSAGAYQSLKEYKSGQKTEIVWTIGHEFAISSTSTESAGKISKYGFQFYLDKKMSVLRAESYEVR